VNITRQYRRSLASRVISLTMVIVGVTVALVALSAYLTVRMQLQGALDRSLLNRAERAVESGAITGGPLQDVPSWVFGAADVRIYSINADGKVSTPDDGPPLLFGAPEAKVLQRDSRTSVRTIAAADGTRYRVATVPAGRGSAMVLAQRTAAEQDLLGRLGLVLFSFGALGVLIAGIAGWIVARNGLRPVRQLTSNVEQIAHTQDLTPLIVEGDDEIARLATAFNQMLIALATSRDRQRQLVADAGHELRTPLTSLRTNLDLLAQADDGGPGQPGEVGLPPHAREELLADVRAQIEELTTLVGDLVELARDERTSMIVEDVDLAEVIDRALSRVRRRAPSLTFDVATMPWWVRGDPTELERAVTNLLDNAAKWSPPDGVVTVTLRDGRLGVADAGPGIASKDLPHVFERFYRSEESRGLAGSGLGLAIVHQVAQRHSGTVEAGRSAAGGALVAMTLPGRPRRDPATAVSDRTPSSGGRPSTVTRRILRSRWTAP
jgi:two-component system, OmpR family, sensor histidine kinase MprB